jgi:hypothetical protein
MGALRSPFDDTSLTTLRAHYYGVRPQRCAGADVRADAPANGSDAPANRHGDVCAPDRDSTHVDARNAA